MAVEKYMVKSVEGIPGYVQRVESDSDTSTAAGGIGVEGSMWDVLVGRIVKNCRVNGVRFLRRAYFCAFLKSGIRG